VCFPPSHAIGHVIGRPASCPHAAPLCIVSFSRRCVHSPWCRAGARYTLSELETTAGELLIEYFRCIMLLKSRNLEILKSCNLD